MIAEAQKKTVIVGKTPPVNSKERDEMENILDELSEGFWQPEIKPMSWPKKKSKDYEGDSLISN